MSMKHTPGPWVAAEYVGDIVVRSGFTECALVRPILHGDNPTGQRIEQCANARLIAAAPDLLGTLQAMVDVFGAEKKRDPRICRAAIEQARTAIAKAIGK